MAVDQNPYAVPTARVDDVAAATSGNFIAEGRRCSAGRGWVWITEGFGMFVRNPGTWIGLMLVWIIVMVVLGIIPFVGSIALNLLMPVFLAGVMLGCHAMWDGEALRVGHLFAGFKNNTGRLMLVGLLYFVGIIVCVLVAFLIAGGPALFASMGDTQAGPASDMLALFGPIGLAILIMLALMIPLFMAFWFAPALVGINAMSAVSGMSSSFNGCLKNILPFLVWGLVFFGLGLILLAILGAMMGGGSIMLGASGSDGAKIGMMLLAGLIYFIFALAIGPIAMASTYAAYRDIYYAD